MRVVDSRGNNKASDKEISNILDVEHQILNELGFKYIQQVFLSGKREEYYNKVSNILQQKYGYIKHYNAIKINYTKPGVISSLEKNIIELNKINLNSLTTQAVKTSMITKRNNHIKKIIKEQEGAHIGAISEGLTREHIKNERFFPENYEEINDIIANRLLAYIFNKSLVEVDNLETKELEI